MDLNTCEIKKSQAFISEQYDHLSSCTDSNKKSVQKVEGEIKTVMKDTDYLLEEVIDLKCRSMQDNLLFFWITENQELK